MTGVQTCALPICLIPATHRKVREPARESQRERASEREREREREGHVEGETQTASKRRERKRARDERGIFTGMHHTVVIHVGVRPGPELDFGLSGPAGGEGRGSGGEGRRAGQGERQVVPVVLEGTQLPVELLELLVLLGLQGDHLLNVSGGGGGRVETGSNMVGGQMAKRKEGGHLGMKEGMDRRGGNREQEQGVRLVRMGRKTL